MGKRKNIEKPPWISEEIRRGIKEWKNWNRKKGNAGSREEKNCT